MIKVMLVEDDPMVREINSKFLAKLQYFKIENTADSISGAKKILSENNDIDLILLDVFLPDGKGLDLLKWIRINEIQVDVILVTADKGAVSVDEAFKYGAVDYLIKPFKLQRFKEALCKYRERKNSFRELVQVDQKNIDEYILERVAEGTAIQEKIEMDKGLSSKTYDKIMEFISRNVGSKFTAEEVAMGSGLSRVTARRYLEKMEGQGKIHMVQEYGRIGRPTNFYYSK